MYLTDLDLNKKITLLRAKNISEQKIQALIDQTNSGLRVSFEDLEKRIQSIENLHGNLEESNIYLISMDVAKYEENLDTLIKYGIDIDNSWNRFNSDIAKIRMRYMVDKTIKYGKLHGCNICHVIITGDLVNNNIHLTSRLSNRENIAKQTVGVSELISEAIAELSKEFKYITLNMADGNHDRIYPNKSDNDYNDSFIHIIKEFIKLRCININNLIIRDNKHGSEIIELNVCGKKIVGLHGDKIPAKATIPRLTTMFGKVDYVIRGHVHNSSQDSFGDSKLITVSSFSGMDEYAKHLGLNSRPSQKILILSSADNDDCIYDVDLSKVEV
jgi:predicted nuclease of predicted toxin-antitoxin system